MFANRSEAGQQLAQRLIHLHDDDVVVVGLPRGGVPVADEVASALDAPLDVLLVRKLGVPDRPELAMGAIGEGDVRVLNGEVIAMAGISQAEIRWTEKRERTELERRGNRYRADRERERLDGRVVVIVDDGIATGSTAKAACEVARAAGARRVVLAVPVAPAGWTGEMAGSADEYVAVETPEWFLGVGQFYRNFSQTSDDEVVSTLDRAATRRCRAAET